jgi:hypothetical protein
MAEPEPDPSPMIWLQFPDGALFQLRTEGSGIALKGNAPINPIEAMTIMTVKAKMLFASEVMGRC